MITYIVRDKYRRDHVRLVPSPSEIWFCGMSVSLGPYSISRDSTTWLSLRFSRSVDTWRRFVFARIVFTRRACYELAPIWWPSGSMFVELCMYGHHL